MAAFHENHFSYFATDHFVSHFLRPEFATAVKYSTNQYDTNENDSDAVDDEYYDEEEDDGLGYYPDGVKRTLTDEQIAIFRHSELEALRRAKEREQEQQRAAAAASSARNQPNDNDHDDDYEEDSLLSEGALSALPTPPLQPVSAAASVSTSSTSNKKNNNNKKRKRGKQHNDGNDDGEVIDLRKRTWDVVDKGLETLDYGSEEDAAQQAETGAYQRRRISYDDD